MKAFEEEINKNDINTINIINSFILALVNNKKNFLKNLDDLLTKNKLNIQTNNNDIKEIKKKK